MKKPVTMPDVKTIDVDGVQAFVFVPNLNEGVELAVVTKDVLAHLTKLLPRVPLNEVITEFSAKTHEVKTIEDWVELLREELNFHESVNLLKYHLSKKPEPAETVREKVTY